MVVLRFIKIYQKFEKIGKRIPITLHNRINLFSQDFPILKDVLTSIKWIGNYASHNEQITRDDILDGYYLLEFSLNKIYDNEEDEIKKITKKIIKTKKPRSK